MEPRIQSRPTEGLSYSPVEPAYYEPDKLDMELERVFDICHGCRLCHNLCPSFPALFGYTDAYDGDVRQLTRVQQQEVIDDCYQCKLCYLKCPYTPDDEHEFQLDFPRLMQRAKAVRTRRHGVAWRERLLGDPDLLGRLAGLTPWLANWANRLKPNRLLLEWVLGIHRRKLLPSFHGRTFQAWFNRNRARYEGEGENGKVFFFPTCFVNYNHPDIGRAAMEIFSRNRIGVRCDYRQCCGMPALDGGDVARAQRMARENIAHLLPHVREGYTVLAVNPTCSMMMRKEYPGLVGTEEARELAEHVMDPNEYLNRLRREGKLDKDFRSTPGRIRYHVPCHLRAQQIGFRSRDMMRAIGGGTEISMVQECSGHDGTWAMKKEYFEMSMQSGRTAFEEMSEDDGATMVSDCPLAAIQFEQATGRRPLHPLQVLARAYRPDGFPQPIEPGD